MPWKQMPPSLAKDWIAQIGKNAKATSQSKKKESIKLKDDAFSAGGKATCTVIAKKEMMAKAKKLKPVKQMLKKPKDRSQMTVMYLQNSCPTNLRSSWVK